MSKTGNPLVILSKCLDFEMFIGKNGAFDELFDIFLSHLKELGLEMNEGKIIDASFVVAPRQRNIKEENKKR